MSSQNKKLHFWNFNNYDSRLAAEKDGATYTCQVSDLVSKTDLDAIVKTISVCLFNSEDDIAYEIE